MRKLNKRAAAPREQLAIKQERGKVTYDALLESGFRLLKERDIEDISIFELAREAGYSVGAFYGRFRSKDEFFDALIERHLASRTATQKDLYAGLSTRLLINEMVANIIDYYWEHHIFWRAVLRRTLRDPEYWAPFRAHFLESTSRFVQRLEKETGRKLTAREQRNVSFAFQTLLGTINISIVNQPGPVLIGQKQFIEESTRAFRLLSEADALLAGTSKTKA